MAEQSTTTNIELINKALENIGERPVVSINSPVARKALQALKDSVYDIASTHDWEWTKDAILAQSWVLDTADLGETQRIHTVSYGSAANGYRELAFLDPVSFDRLPQQVGEPRNYTQSTYNKVRVNPYPNTPEEQAKYKFFVTRELTPGNNATDVLPFPERVLTLVLYRMCYYLCVSHLDDAGAAQQWGQQYVNLLQRLRSRERGYSHRQTNMFRFFR